MMARERVRYALLIAVLAAAPVAAQDPEDDVARRLEALIEERFDALRAELHRAVDEALAARAARTLVLVPASNEFRELFRLPDGCGWRVVDVGGPAGPDLRPGDVIIGVAGGLATRLDAVVAAFRAPSGGMTVVRRGDRVETTWGRPEANVAETSDAMFERLWRQAFAEVVPEGGMIVTGAESEPESRPVKKNPTPRNEGRR
jgi:hypothetical protein